jgi:hypothetical protein
MQRSADNPTPLNPTEVVGLMRNIVKQNVFEPIDSMFEPHEFAIRAKRLLFEIIRPYSTEIKYIGEENMGINIPQVIHQDELDKILDAYQYRQICNIVSS